jgi:type VI protein secretion system component VasF
VSNTPTLRGQREAHDRRARLINQLHAQATGTADNQSARRGEAKAQIAGGVWRRAAVASLLAAGCLFWGLAIVAVGYLIARGL